jgi:hypothetical protein
MQLLGSFIFGIAVGVLVAVVAIEWYIIIRMLCKPLNSESCDEPVKTGGQKPVVSPSGFYHE